MMIDSLSKLTVHDPAYELAHADYMLIVEEMESMSLAAIGEQARLNGDDSSPAITDFLLLSAQRDEILHAMTLVMGTNLYPQTHHRYREISEQMEQPTLAIFTALYNRQWAIAD